MTSDSSKPRIVFVNRSYWPDVEATGQLLTQLCEGLADEFQVEVVAGLPNSLSADAPADWKSQTVHNGVRIHRLRHLQLPKRRMILRIANYLSFQWSVRRMLKRLGRPDVLVFETDPFTLATEAGRLMDRGPVRVVGYLQDIHPDVGVAMGKVPSNRYVRSIRRELFDVYHRCDQMVVLSSDMRQLLLEDGIAPDRVQVIPNWADVQRIWPLEGHNAFRQKHGLVDKFVVMYSGNFGLTQRLDHFVQAAAQLTDDRRIHFVFVGRGSLEQALRRQVQQLGLTNVTITGYQALSGLNVSLNAADLHLVPLTAQLTRCLMPSKLYGILAAGRPLLTNAPAESELHRLTVQHKVGLVVQPQRIDQIVQQIRWASAHPQEMQQLGHNARNLALQQFTFEHSLQKFRKLLHSVLATAPGHVNCQCCHQVTNKQTRQPANNTNQHG